MLLGDADRDLRALAVELLSKLDAAEEPRGIDPVGPAHVRGIQVHELGGSHADARALDHPALHGDIGAVLVLHPRRRLHLPQPEGAVRQPLERIHVDAHALVLEDRLEDGGDRGVAQEFARLVQRLGVSPGRVADQDPAEEERMRASSDAVAEIEDGLLRRIRRRRELGLVGREPEALRALEAREVAGLAEVEPGGRHGHSVP